MLKKKPQGVQLSLDLAGPPLKEAQPEPAAASGAARPAPPLPEGWKWVKLQDFSFNPKNDVVDGPFGSNLKASEYVDTGVPIIRLQNIDRNQFLNKKIQFITPTKAQELKRHNFQKGDIVITKLGDPLGKACVVPDDFEYGVIVADVVRVRINPDAVNKKYLVYAINSQLVIEQLEPLVKGSTRPRVNLGHIRNLLIPTAPLPDQERIVAKIEALFTQLEAGVDALKRVQAGLKRYKASVLKAAVEGRLLDEARPNAGGAGALPEGWRWATVGELTQKMQYGTSDKADLDETGIPVLRMGNIRDGILDFKNLKYLPKKTKGLEELILKPGDILFNRTNSAELVGKTAVYRKNHPKATFASYLIRVKVKPDVLPDFVTFCINSFHGRKYITSVVSQQVGQANVNGTKLSNMPIPLPPLPEQRRIVAEVERRLEGTQEIEAVTAASLARAGRLRQAVLKAAFEGRLV